MPRKNALPPKKATRFETIPVELVKENAEPDVATGTAGTTKGTDPPSGIRVTPRSPRPPAGKKP